MIQEIARVFSKTIQGHSSGSGKHWQLLIGRGEYRALLGIVEFSDPDQRVRDI